MIWIWFANSHTGPQHKPLHQKAGQMAASDIMLNQTLLLHLNGRPQMGNGRSALGTEDGEGRRKLTEAVVAGIAPKLAAWRARSGYE